MSIILNFNLTYNPSSVQEIICLFDPSPPFQYSEDSLGNFSIVPDVGLLRDINTPIAGFPASIASNNILHSLLPANSFTVNLPSLVYGTASTADNYGVLQINSALAKIEPGFSRLRIKYTWYNQATNSFLQQIDYFDCPFYEGWKNTAQELNNIKNYIEGGISFLETEIAKLQTESFYVLNSAFWRGISVSGQVIANTINQGLLTGPLLRSEFSHALALPELLSKGPGEPNSGDCTVTGSQFVDDTLVTIDVSWGGFSGSGFSLAVDPIFGTLVDCLQFTSGTGLFSLSYSTSTEGMSIFLTDTGGNIILNINPPDGESYRANLSLSPGTYNVWFSPTYNPSSASLLSVFGPSTVSAVLSFADDTAPLPTVQAPVAITSLSASEVCINGQITVNGSNFSNRSLSVTVNGSPAQFSLISDAQLAVTIPSISAGNATLTVLDNLGNSASISFTALGFPSITNIVPSQTFPLSFISITGTGFGPFGTTTDGNPVNNAVIINGTNCVINSWSDSAITAQVPNTSLGATQAIVQGYCGDSSGFSFVVISPDSLQISPHLEVVSLGSSFQFNANFSQGTSHVQSVVTNSPNISWFVNGIFGGGPTFGTISPGGLYLAPQNNPGQPILVSANYTDITSNGTIILTDNSSVQLVAFPQIILTPTFATLLAGQTLQFQVLLFVNGNLSFVTAQSSFFVNNSPNGNISTGFFSGPGFYNSPGFLSSQSIFNIEVTYVFQGTPLTASATVTVNVAPVNVAVVTASTQLNIYLGDGRFGYIPSGSFVSAYLNYYVYVEFQELLDSVSQVPISTFLPSQQLTLYGKNALDPDIGNVLYNLGDKILNTNGTMSTKRTVVLGIIDPTDGAFHSPWDIAYPATQIANLQQVANPLSKDLSFDSFESNTLDYIDEVSNGNPQYLESLNKKSNVFVLGECHYDVPSKMLQLNKPLRIFGVAEDNSMNELATFEEQNILLQNYQYLYFDGNDLKVKNFTDTFEEDKIKETIILGSVLNERFYSQWPLENTEAANGLGPFLFQKGTEELTILKKTASLVEIHFEQKFQKSYAIIPALKVLETSDQMTKPIAFGINKTLSGFDLKVMNGSNSTVKCQAEWMVVGI